MMSEAGLNGPSVRTGGTVWGPRSPGARLFRARTSGVTRGQVPSETTGLFPRGRHPSLSEGFAAQGTRLERSPSSRAALPSQPFSEARAKEGARHSLVPGRIPSLLWANKRKGLFRAGTASVRRAIDCPRSVPAPLLTRARMVSDPGLKGTSARMGGTVWGPQWPGTRHFRVRTSGVTRGQVPSEPTAMARFGYHPSPSERLMLELDGEPSIMRRMVVPE